MHARKALLDGLSPRQNREVPPLRHEVVHRAKRDFPDLEIVLNGGIRDLGEARRHLAHVDGVMIGRAACDDPWLLAEADREIFGAGPSPQSRHDVLRRFMEYMERRLAHGDALHAMTRHFVGAFRGVPGARAFRRHLAENGVKPDAGVRVLRDAMARVEDRAPQPVAA